MTFPERPTRVNAPQESPTRVSTMAPHKSACPTGVVRECPTKASPTRVSPTRVPYEFSTRAFPTSMSYKSERPTSVARECPTTVFQKSVPQECQTMFGRLFSSAYAHSGSWAPSCVLNKGGQNGEHHFCYPAKRRKAAYYLLPIQHTKQEGKGN